MADKVIDSSLKGYGTIRLSKLDSEDLKTVARAFEVDHADKTAAEIVALILEKKKHLPVVVVKDVQRVDLEDRDDLPRVEEIAEEEDAGDGEGEAEEAGPEEGDEDGKDEKEEDEQDGESEYVVVPPRPAIRIIAFNSCKLRVDDGSMDNHWIALFGEMASSDVVMASEVPGGKAEKRLGMMRKMLEGSTGKKWASVVSEQSNGEVHGCFLKEGMTLLKSKTLHEAGGTKLDYAPLQVLAEDTSGQRYVFTSVHFPPVKRANDRDLQLGAFLKAYSSEAAARMDQPFTERGARDARKDEVLHVVGGDFNVFPPDRHREECRNFATFIGSRVATTSGGRSFDHFLVNSDGAGAFAMSADVIELASPKNSRKGEKGLSDHHPISLLIRQAPRAKR